VQSSQLDALPLALLDTFVKLVQAPNQALFPAARGTIR
jgi:hypothetical protein